jgi:Tfp pilus assembly protein PilF
MSAAAQAFDAAVMMMRAGKQEEAASLCWDIVRKDRGVVEAWALLARVEGEAGRHRNAMMYHGMALQVDPSRWNQWHDSALDAMSARMYVESERAFKKALELHDNGQTRYNYGNLLSTLMRVEEAVEQFKLAKEMGFDDPQIHANLGVALIGTGNWKEGFNAYRHRFNAPGFPPRPRFNYPIWRGEPLEGKTIMLYVEQGFGDEIMSMRYAHRVWSWLGCTVILAVRAPMYRLARQWEAPNRHVMLMYDKPPVEPDFMCALLDVPAHMDITPDTNPCKNGYLKADDRSFRLNMPRGLNVGICWASGKRELQREVAETARQKSLTLDELAGPLVREGVNLFSLQQNHRDDLKKYGVRDPMAGVTDFADTAFIIDHLDLVITVDTSVAHLAGAMGKPVWNLVRFDAIWPWMQETEKTCWYDSMTLYRQGEPYNWKDVLKRLEADFTAYADYHIKRLALPSVRTISPYWPAA